MIGTRSRRAIAVLAVVLAGVFGPLVVAPRAVSAAGRGGVVVVHTSSVETRCVALPDAGQRALWALDRTDLSLYTISFGGISGRFICLVDGEGTGTSSSCPAALSDPYWGVWIQRRGKKTPAEAQVGVGALKLYPGDRLYLVWHTYPQDAPTPVSLGTICST